MELDKGITESSSSQSHGHGIKLEESNSKNFGVYLSKFLQLDLELAKEDYVFSDGYIIKAESLVGEFHIGSDSREKNIELAKHTQLRRGLLLARSVLSGLSLLSGDLADPGDDAWPFYKDIDVFYGSSDLINPNYLKRYGFHVEEYKKDDSGELKERIMEDSKDLFGNIRNIGTIYEFYATTQQIVDASDKIWEDFRRITERVRRDQFVTSETLYTLLGELQSQSPDE